MVFLNTAATWNKIYILGLNNTVVLYLSPLSVYVYTHDIYILYLSHFVYTLDMYYPYNVTDMHVYTYGDISATG